VNDKISLRACWNAGFAARLGPGAVGLLVAAALLTARPGLGGSPEAARAMLPRIEQIPAAAVLTENPGLRAPRAAQSEAVPNTGPRERPSGKLRAERAGLPSAVQAPQGSAPGDLALMGTHSNCRGCSATLRQEALGSAELAGQLAVQQQSGDSLQLSLSQFGADNRAFQEQSGRGSTATLEQRGTGNEAVQIQIGDGLVQHVTQSGGAVVTVIQTR